VETDAPFLTPTPYRGRPNASFLVPLTVRFMAGIVGVSDEELCRQITTNTDRAFGGPWAERI
jgi:TatD DNase family protein